MGKINIYYMKKLILSIFLLISILFANAQDTIVKGDGEKVSAKVTEIGSSYVKYKKFTNLNGPDYEINRDEIKVIVFENGEIESFNQMDSSSNNHSKKNTTPEIASGKAQVYFIRSTGFAGSASAFKAFIDEEFVCNLNNKRYSIHEVDSGEHIFTVQFAGKNPKKRAEPIKINTQAGKTYYVQMVFQTGILKNNLYCQEVTANSAETVLINLKQDTKCF